MTTVLEMGSAQLPVLSCVSPFSTATAAAAAANTRDCNL